MQPTLQQPSKRLHHMSKKIQKLIAGGKVESLGLKAANKNKRYVLLIEMFCSKNCSRRSFSDSLKASSKMSNRRKKTDAKCATEYRTAQMRTHEGENKSARTEEI